MVGLLRADGALEGASANDSGLVFVECWALGEDGALRGTFGKGGFLVVVADPVS